MPTVHRDSSPELSEDLDSPIEEEEEVEEEEGDLVEEEEEEEGDLVEEEEEEEGDEEEAEDTSKQLEPEGHGEDLKLVSSTIGSSERNPASPSKDAPDGSIIGHDSSAKILEANNKEVSDVYVPDILSEVQDKHISSEEKECTKSLVDEKEITDSFEKKTSSEDPERVKNFYLEVHGSHGSHLSSGDSIGSENIAPLQVHSKELAETIMAKDSSTIGESDGVLEKEVSQLHQKTELKMPEDLSLSSMLTPEKRHRSASPGATPENLSKRPAIVCAYFARGWCIKGNSCLFLHQKEGGKEDLTEPSGKGDVLDGTGSRGEAERLKISSSQEQPDSSNSGSSSKSQLQIQRALVRAYGGESHESPHFHDDCNIPSAEELHTVGVPRVGCTLIRDEYKSPFAVGPPVPYVDEQRSASEHFLSRRYLHEEQLQQEMPKMEFVNDAPFHRGSSLTSSAVPEHRYCSGGSFTSSSLYPNYHYPFARVRRTEDFAFRNHQSSFLLRGSYSPYSLSGSLSSTFNSSYQPAPTSSFSSERLDIHKMFDFDKDYHRSRSASLPSSSSPYFSRPEVESSHLGNVPRDLPASVRQKKGTQENSWEPSVPFRPSFHYVPAGLSFPGSQYDPLLDSIETRTTRNIALQASERTINANISGHSIKHDPLLCGSQIVEFNMEKTLSSFPQRCEAILDQRQPAHGLSRQTSLAATPGDSAVDRGNNSVPKEEKYWIPNNSIESANVNGGEHDGDLRYQEDKSRISKESKAMKIFRAALVDFVKELIKPAWREGHLTKDAHKMVVKKVVEKVLSALQSHQIPNTTESISQYLSLSRPKILKLVEGYVEKYAKS